METSKLEKQADSNENIAKVVQQLSNNLEEFIYAISHDLKSPLIPILGFSDLLKKRFSSDLPEKALKYIDRIQKNAHRLEQYLEALLRLSRIGRDIDPKTSKTFERINLINLIKRSCAEYLNTAKKIGVSIDIDEKHTIPVEKEFIGIIDSLFREIISNAIKFQYQPDELNPETLSESGSKKVVKIYKIEPNNPQYSLIISLLLGTNSNGPNSSKNSVYINPVLISDLANQSSKPSEEIKNPEIICIEDNGIGFKQESWKDLLRVFMIADDPVSLYAKSKSINSENDYFKDLFLTFTEPMGIGFPIKKKICRISGISAVIESVPVEDKNSILHGTLFYLIFPPTS